MDGSLVAYPLAQLQQHVALHLQFQPQSQFQPPRPPREAAAALHDAAVVLKRRRCAVAVDEVPGFVRTVFTLLRVCDPDVISWSPNGAQIVIRDSDRFASEVCPKFFRHRNLHSFTRLLNMYQFHKVPTTQRDSKDVSFEHPHFQRGRDDLLSLVQRKGAQHVRDELVARELRARAERGLPPPGLEEAAAAGASQPCDWNRRMAELESEVRALKAENDRLKDAEAEAQSLELKLSSQKALISALQAQREARLRGACGDAATCSAAAFAPPHWAPAQSLASSTDDDSMAAESMAAALQHVMAQVQAHHNAQSQQLLQQAHPHACHAQWSPAATSEPSAKRGRDP